MIYAGMWGYVNWAVNVGRTGMAAQTTREWREISLAGNRSELDHGKAWDSLEIAEVQCRDSVAEMQGRRPDH